MVPPKAQPLLDYFTTTYIGSTTERNGVTRVVRARFPSEQWNVHQQTVRAVERAPADRQSSGTCTSRPSTTQTVDDAARTSNYAEAWNRGFESLVANGHPRVWTVIDMLRADAAEASATLLKYAAGSLPKKRCRRVAARTHHRLRQYAASSRSVDQFLKAVSHNIHKQR